MVSGRASLPLAASGSATPQLQRGSTVYLGHLKPETDDIIARQLLSVRLIRLGYVGRLYRILDRRLYRRVDRLYKIDWSVRRLD